ncbi:MAG: fibrobacter succinogenes major paralogous domain-containing protein [Saprospiraceae bacterium]|nr:fibrobacter succinogenes major paralogous domain-containing protein [Saprospiraceae bacterium]
MKKSILSVVYLSIHLAINLNAQVLNSLELGNGTARQRNASFNLEELKVRWKKAALENCTGVPCVVAPSFTCGSSTISDVDNNSYVTVLIGTQCWTKENLKVSKYNDGSPINFNTSGGPLGNSFGEDWSTQTSGAFSIYSNDPISSSNASFFGYLYNWYAVSDARKLCPTNWHVPSKVEWQALETQLGGPSLAGGEMKQAGSSLWTTSPSGTSGFRAQPGGERWGSDGSFNSVNGRASFWSSTETLPTIPDYLYVDDASTAITFTDAGYEFGFSIRCLKDL